MFFSCNGTAVYRLALVICKPAVSVFCASYFKIWEFRFRSSIESASNFTVDCKNINSETNETHSTKTHATRLLCQSLQCFFL